GHINVRHIEPMMNTVHPVLTFLNRCNSDVSSLLSGTAVKAVVSYVSDYISKLSLKSYQMFASVYDVFEKDAEIRGGTPRDKDNARHLMRKMVNSMTAKMEIGSPMASLYLLGNPDRYASHTYVPFAWRQYVQFVRAFWVSNGPAEEEEEEEDEGMCADDEERLPIGRMDGKFVPASAVDDYRFRPDAYSALNLYEWVQCSKKKKRSIKEREKFEEEIRLKVLESELDDDDDEEDVQEPITRLIGSTDPDGESDWETDDEENVILDKQAKINRNNRPIQLPFQVDHPMFKSHSVCCNFESMHSVIPNFIGGTVPRSDKGDRATYCMTMLTLFKAWR
ncbi:hypothetical protein B0H16DRAFT_1262450, partial [Mycena metata]